MDQVFIPEAILGLPRLSFEDVHFIYYQQTHNYPKNRVIFHCNAISMVLHGVKEVYRFSEKTTIRSQEATLIPEGNSLIAERTVGNDPYSSLVVLFSTQRVLALLDRLNDAKARATTGQGTSLKFHQNEYLRQYVQHMIQLIQKEPDLSPRLVLHKFEELLLVLVEQYPAPFFSVFRSPSGLGQVSLKNIIENNIMENLSLEELAFMVHKSLSSFKREFEKTYGVSPGKYIRERKLEIASKELRLGKNASELYLSYGYESVSNFIQAFKKKFGVTPKEFQVSIRVGNENLLS